LGVHLNGNFSLTSARRGIFQSKSDLPRKDSDKNVKQNLYILYDVLPDLHVKLLDYVVKKHENKEANFRPYIMNNLWPNTKNVTMNFFKNYGLNVIKKLGNDIHRIFWTEANGGQFISLEDAKIFSKKEEIIVDILVSSGISAVMLEEDKIKQLNEIIEPGESEFPYKPVSGESICEDLLLKISSIPIFKRKDMIVDERNEYTHDDLFTLLEFILRDKNSYEILSGLPLVPLSNGLVGKFGEDYYVGHEFLDLFPDIGPSKFVSASLPENLSIIFKKFNASAVLDLLDSVLKPVRELKWNPNGKSLPDRRWFERIWLILNNDASNIDFDKLSKFPILSTIKPSNMLVRPDISIHLYKTETVYSHYLIY
jgi:hypothetical protein